MKICNRCNEIKPIESFRKIKGRATTQSWCKVCDSKRVRSIQKANPEKYKYQPSRNVCRHGISEDEFETMKSRYNGKCWICQSSDAVCIDHDHSCCTGVYGCKDCVRGVLCKDCNLGIGLLRENETILLRSIEYLSRAIGEKVS